MRLSPVVGRYFEAWIGQDSWDSYHPLDLERFYRFVKAVARYNRKAPLPREIHTLVVERWRGRRDRRDLSKAANYFADLYQTLMAYESTRRFPDALIERTDIVKYHTALSVRGGSNERQIDRIMTSEWGKDWRTRLDKSWRETTRSPNRRSPDRVEEDDR